MVLSWSFCFLLFLLMHDGSSLIMERLEIPPLAKLFQPLKIACRFRLGTLRLESVKWYKDDDEFFRFTPSEQPHNRKFNITGIEIDMEKSDMHVASLLNVSVSSAGVYRCEVSSDSPAFETVQESRRMDVYCDYMNEKCIKKEYITRDESGLLTKHSLLRVRARGGPGPILVSCVGSQGQDFLPQRTQVELTLGKYVDYDPMAQRGSANYTSDDFKSYISLGLFMQLLLSYCN
ncbi:uncharacterized protein [Halyomorpha halys]|uniref:uncharacterized protein isoform X2 n=1 Tax=Halyomorpha halys TaxID=286706 RepID=UPI0034D28F33